jgi:hypothetical protein
MPIQWPDKPLTPGRCEDLDEVAGQSFGGWAWQDWGPVAQSQSFGGWAWQAWQNAQPAQDLDGDDTCSVCTDSSYGFPHYIPRPVDQNLSEVRFIMTPHARQNMPQPRANVVLAMDVHEMTLSRYEAITGIRMAAAAGDQGMVDDMMPLAMFQQPFRVYTMVKELKKGPEHRPVRLLVQRRDRDARGDDIEVLSCDTLIGASTIRQHLLLDNGVMLKHGTGFGEVVLPLSGALSNVMAMRQTLCITAHGTLHGDGKRAREAGDMEPFEASEAADCLHFPGAVSGPYLDALKARLQQLHDYCVAHTMKMWNAPGGQATVSSRPKLVFSVVLNSENCFGLYDWGQIEADYFLIAVMPEFGLELRDLLMKTFPSMKPTNHMLITWSEAIPGHHDKRFNALSLKGKIETSSEFYCLSFGPPREFQLLDGDVVQRTIPFCDGDMVAVPGAVNARLKHRVTGPAINKGARASIVFRDVSAHTVNVEGSYYTKDGNRKEFPKKDRHLQPQIPLQLLAPLNTASGDEKPSSSPPLAHI